MRDCDKRQKENYKGTDRLRCIHPESEVRNEIVVESVCEDCPLVQLKVKTCKEKRKEQALMVHGTHPALVVNQKTKSKQLPLLDLQSGFSQCPYRYWEDEKPKCQITGLGVTTSICNRCDQETAKHEAGLGEKVQNYFGAVRRWVAMGRPTRTKEEIEQIFQEHCKGCERYDAEKHACKNCGCAVSEDASPLTNKLAMATENCPLGRF